MDAEMEDTIEFTFTVFEIDLDYEFDAARYFDFSRAESLAEARQAELWFASATSCPPSPFVTKLLLREDMLLENVNISPKSKGADSNIGMGLEFSTMEVSTDIGEMEGGISTDLKNFNLQKIQNQPHHLSTGLTVYNHMRNDNRKAKTKSAVKPSFPRTSTLMKPTVSQLAKQIHSVRIQKVENNEKDSNNYSGIESQAPKRQKLEGGHLHKVADTNQQTNFVHKAPKKDGTVDGNSTHSKLRLTIPREPDLETAHRAQRIRPKIVRERNHGTVTAPTFRARPLNKKILEAPSLLLPKRSTPRVPDFQEFHLKTSERAMQHTSAVSSSSSSFHCNNSKVLLKPSAVPIAECDNRESRSRPNVVDAPNQPRSEIVHKFKALPFNKKIFSSKGDIGVFRNSKRETTVPMEFNFHTEKKVHHDPPIDLFNKLTLTSEFQRKNGSQVKLPRPTCLLRKGSKENRPGSFQQESEIEHLAKGRQPRFGLKQIQVDPLPSTNTTTTTTSRSLGVR